MNTDTTRRSFLAGLGAVLVATKLPAVEGDMVSFSAPQFTLPPNPNGWNFTAQYLMDCMQSIGAQLERYAGTPLSATQREQIGDSIDEALWHVRPAGLQILIDAPLETIAAGKFQIFERAPGTVSICNESSGSS